MSLAEDSQELQPSSGSGGLELDLGGAGVGSFDSDPSAKRRRMDDPPSTQPTKPGPNTALEA
eukprot:4378593-Alexandrium_andersonii.AAC.1